MSLSSISTFFVVLKSSEKREGPHVDLDCVQC